jgi:acetyl esterase/lipase
MIGFSAGGHLTAMAATHFDAGDPSAGDPIERVSSRPDFIILGYPLITFVGMPTDTGFAGVFLGPHPSPASIKHLSANLYVTARTPPTFIYATTTDNLIPVEQSLLFYRALHAAGVSVEMHLFAQGPHGTGLGSADPALDFWPALLENWLRARGLLSVAPEARAQAHTAGPLSIESTIGELLNDPAARAVLQRELPQLVSSPQIAQARDMSLASLQPYAPQMLTREVLKTVDEMLRTATADRK